MAESMFKQSTTTKSRKTWRMVVIGAAVPFAMLAAAPAVSAAENEVNDAAQTEQLPDLPVPAPDLPVPGGLDPTALLDLSTCLTDLQAALPADAPLPAELEEQLPGLPLPDPGLPVPAPGGDAPLPDLAALNQTCQDILAQVTGAVPAPADVPAPAPAQ